MDDGRKCHIKFYILLICAEDGVCWDLYTYKSAFLSISPNKWSPDVSAQATCHCVIMSAIDLAVVYLMSGAPLRH